VSAPYRSKPGTYERIYKAVLEDPELTNAEFRVLLYGATKQRGWVLHARPLAKALGRSMYEIEGAIRGLRRKGYVVGGQARDERGRTGQWENRLDYDRVVAPDNPQVSTGHPESAPPGTTWENTTKRQVAPSHRDYRSPEIRPPSEYESFSDDGLKESECRKSRTPPAAAGRVPPPGDIRRQDPDRRAAELIVTAYMAAHAGSDWAWNEPVVCYMQVTFTSPRFHKDVAAYACYLLRGFIAARDLMDELATLRNDVGVYFLEEAAALLRNRLRPAIAAQRLTPEQREKCQELGAWAEAAVAEDYGVYDDNKFVPLPPQLAIDIGRNRGLRDSPFNSTVMSGARTGPDPGERQEHDGNRE
jgi:hypothetical protein